MESNKTATYLEGVEEECNLENALYICRSLTPKGQRPFFGPFLDIGQTIVDAIFVQKISNFW
jgi:hypothetical protein